MTPQEFVTIWKGAARSERAQSHEHFLHLCGILGVKGPSEADPKRTWYTFERELAKNDGRPGFADVWRRGYFAWEYKGAHKNLDVAYSQLKQYTDALQNPPLLVVSDMETIRVHSNFTNTVKQVYEFTLDDLLDHQKRKKLEALFSDPNSFKPGVTRAAVTKEAATLFCELAAALGARHPDQQMVAHFLNRLIFCMFAEDIGLLPKKLFTKMIEKSIPFPDRFKGRAQKLFEAMHVGGDWDLENIQWFNGGLFDSSDALDLTSDELTIVFNAATLDWSEIEPSILGTLFERGLDPAKRSQLGAQYTDPATIMKIIDPVICQPLLREWDTEKTAIAALMAKADVHGNTKGATSKQLEARTKSRNAATKRFAAFLERLRSFTVLDPACGSGNFLYLALRSLKDIEKKVIVEAEALSLPRQFPEVGPRAVYGIEINPYAAELARVAIWIGEIQWMIQNGFNYKRNPILQALEQIQCRDALLNPDGQEAEWPAVTVIVGNPPFLGDKWMRAELGDVYTDALRSCYRGRVAGGCDLVMFWFEKTRVALQTGATARAGLVSTNSIRQPRNRAVLRELQKHCAIYNAWSDEEWINDGANVRVSLTCFAPLQHQHPVALNGEPADSINADLTRGGTQEIDLTKTKTIAANKGKSFFGLCLAGKFDVPGDLARQWLSQPNPSGKPNSDVVRPIRDGNDVQKRNSDTWVIDFGATMDEGEACFYEAPFKHLEENVKQARSDNREAVRVKKWWRMGRPRPALRKALSGLTRYIATVETSKHRVFVWLPVAIAPEHRLVVIPRDDDVTFGILSSSIHLLWAFEKKGTLEDRPVYNTTQCFDTFPFPPGLSPDIPASRHSDNPHAEAIADASRKLVAARDEWLNPSSWVEKVPESVEGLPDRIIPMPGKADDLKQRTLTRLYNEMPHWLVTLQARLDSAVAAAYGWTWPLSDSEIKSRLFELNQKIGE